MGGIVGAAAHKNEEGRARLTRRDPLTEQTLQASNISLDGHSIEAVRRWSNDLIKARDAWADSNRNGRRYSDRDAPGETVRRANTFGAQRYDR